MPVKKNYIPWNKGKRWNCFKLKGRTPWQKILGDNHPKVIEYKKKMAVRMSNERKGKESWSKGKNKNIDNRLMKTSNSLKKRYKEDKEIKCGFKKGHKLPDNQRKLTSIRMKNGGALKARFAKRKKGDTKIEQLMENYLNEIKIQYVKKYRIDNFEADFFVPSINLVIECDGEYWHNYPHHTKKDIERDYYMMKKGFYVVRFWEREIRNKIYCLNIITQVIKIYKMGDVFCKCQ
jgi:very-short-patch-repair endonuclease